MATISFRTGNTSPPYGYRTPSPPIRYIKPLSPGTAAWSESWSNPYRNQRTTKLHVDDASHYRASRKSLKSSKRGAPASTQDDTALSAFTTNGDDKQQQQRYVEHTWDQNHSQSAQQEPAERPHKRARNERRVSRDWPFVNSRPKTDNTPDLEARRIEAELLLNFSREACVEAYKHASQPTSPLFITNHSQSFQSPPRNLDHPDFAPNVVSNKHGNEGYAWLTGQTIRDPMDTSLAHDHHARNNIGANIHHRMLSTGGVLGTLNGMDTGNERREQNFLNGEDQKELGYKHTNGHVLEQERANTVIENHSTSEVPHVAAASLYNGSAIANKPSNDELPTREHSFLLAGIEEAARADTAGLPDNNGEMKDSQPDSKSSPAKQKDNDSPSVCAACNFFRNTLTLETENDGTSWISCDGCKSWFHFACAGFKNEREVRGVDKFRCRSCKSIHGPTTYVRKSARAHSAIDYAGLNEGIIKTSDENPEHHYIKPIKEGTIKFDPETFARMRPELVTADYFEKGDGMKEPIVIPAEFNPRPRPIPNLPAQSHDENIMSEEKDVPIISDTSILEHWLSEGYEYQTVPDCGQDSLDMVIPIDLTVRKVAELYGPEEKVEVIDVKSQNGEDKKWNMKRWVDYYESQGNKVVRNVISLEVAQSKLGHLIKRPKVVRDLDLHDSVWPGELLAKGEYPKVQFYCLMSVADCFTDFHIDFGGSSVYYHILKGKKTFFFIPPHEKHLKKYEEWCNSPAQNWTFLGDQTKECYRVDLSEGDTMLIPAGWIHAVWTPEDSLVIGGNFLTRMHYPMQIRVTQIEKATNVARKFRYPYFQKIMWYAALRYLEEDPIPESVVEILASGRQFPREVPTHLDFDGWGENSVPGDENYHVRYYPKAELDGLPDLGRYLQRTALIAVGNITEGISVETKNAVKRSIPKGHGDPLEIVKKFAMWYTWKRGNENIPHWAYPDYVPEGGAPELAEKKLSARTLKRLDREAALTAWKVAPDRQSMRTKMQPQNLLTETTAGQSTPTQPKKGSPVPSPELENGAKRKARTSPAAASPEVSTPPSRKSKLPSATKTSSNRRPACEACRRGRRACKHRGDPVTPSAASSVQTIIGPFKANEAMSNEILTTQAGDAVQDEDASKGDVNLNRNALRMLHVEIVRPGPPLQNSPQENTPAKPNTQIDEASSTPKSSGRSKACKDCRKSKRRCVHDEFGNEDPVKLAEAAIPRPAAKRKKAEGESPHSPTAKRSKKQGGSPAGTETPASPEQTKPSISVVVPATRVDDVASRPDIVGSEAPAPSLNGNISINQGENGNPEGEPSTAPVPNPEDEVNLISTSPYSEVKFEERIERRAISPADSTLKLPITSSLVSPPESTHTDREQTPPASAQVVPKAETPPVTSSSSRQSSSWPVNSKTGTVHQRYTPESGTNRRTSISSEGQALEVVENVSPMMMGSALHKRTKSSRMSSEIMADEESLKLIRELQAQDMGLRRRGRVQ